MTRGLHRIAPQAITQRVWHQRAQAAGACTRPIGYREIWSPLEECVGAGVFSFDSPIPSHLAVDI